MAGTAEVIPGSAFAGLSERQKAVAFVTVLVATVLEVADATIVNTALPAIREGLLASPGAMQWIVASYMLTLGSLLLLGGRLGDAFGYSRVFIAGVGAFVLASVLCGVAQSPTQLVMARMVQGAAGAVMAPQTMAIVQLLYSPLERVSKLAYFGLIVGLAAIAGPIVGGLLIDLDLFGLGWRLVFLINLPVGMAAIAVGLFALPRPVPEKGLRIDPAGALIFVTGFGSMIYALIEGSEEGWNAFRLALLPIAVGLIVFGWLRAVRRRAQNHPSIIEPALFRIATFRWGVLTALCFSVASMGFLLVFAVSLQQGLGLSPLETALVHIPFGAGVMAGVGVLVPRLLPRLGKLLPIVAGVVMIVSVTIALQLVAGGNGGSWRLLAVLVFAGLGMGALSGPLAPIVVSQVDRQNAGTASATLRTAQQIGGAFGVAVVGAAYFSVPGLDPAARLAGLVPANVAIVVALALSVAAVSRLPADLFGLRGGKPA